MTTTQASRDATTNTAPDGLALLGADHRAVEKLFAAFKKAADDDLEAKSTLAQRACEELSIHTVLEEEMLYPAAQKALPDSDKLDVEEAYIEHYLVKTLIQKFETLRAGDTGFDATFKVMSEMVGHHVEEEEQELFPALRKTDCDLRALGEKMAKRKAELQSRLDAVGSKSVGDNTAVF
jgi:hemerythrin superfamily protein